MKNPSNYPHFLRRLWWNSLKSKQTSAEAEGGYALMMTSAMTVMLFGLIAAYMSITELNRTSTNANTSARNTIVASQSGLNLEANRVREILKDGQPPAGLLPGSVTTADATNMRFCLDNDNTNDGSGDFQCRYYYFDHQGNEDRRIDANSSNRLTRYIAAAFLADTTTYQPDGTVNFTRIPADENFGGLNALLYRYNSFSMAFSTSTQDSSTRPDVNQADAVDGTDATIIDSLSGRNGQIPLAQTVMQMQFTNYVIPLFQFAAFYSSDLEINSTSRMVLNGPVHTNGALFVEPTPNDPATACNDPTKQMVLFQGNVTAFNGIYTNVKSSSLHRPGITCFETGNTTNPFLELPKASPTEDRLTPTQIGTMNGLLKEGPTDIKQLNPPKSASLQPFNASNKANDYYAAADLRIIMRPSRGQPNATEAAKALPDRDAVPFDLQVLHKGSLAANAAISCPSAADDTRDNPTPAKDINCRQLTPGALRSLMHPVLVMPQASTSINTQQTARFCQNNPSAIVDSTLATPPGLNNNEWDYVLKAMTVAMASEPRAIPLDYMSVPFNTLKGRTGYDKFGKNFERLINASDSNKPGKLTVPSIPKKVSDKSDEIMALSPMQIAQMRNTCFLAPAVQWVSQWDYNNNQWDVTQDGQQLYYDRREKRRMRLIQTNIESLTVWNRDGRFAPFTSSGNNPNAITDEQLESMQSLAMTGTGDIYSSNNLLFVRQDNTSITLTPAPSANTFYRLGLGALDGFPITKVPASQTALINSIRNNTNNNGLVIHASLADDFDGDGAADLTIDSTNNLRQYRAAKANGNIDSTSTTTSTRASYFGFVVSGGRNLPAPLSFVSDHSVYIQGDYNSLGSAVGTSPTEEETNKLPAAFMADTITNLSNNCNSAVDRSVAPTADSTRPLTPIPTLKTVVTSIPSTLQMPRAQVDCGVTESTTEALNQFRALGTVVNAAYLSNTDVSSGNQNDTDPTTRFSGGLNNYMRMVEDWSGVTFRYRGSFISLSERTANSRGPINANGAYVFGSRNSTSYYMVPTRDYAYDTYFNSFTNLPPMTPTVVYQKQNLLRREYQFSSGPTSPTNSVAILGLPYREPRHGFNPFQLMG
jgi:hypothetical protein